MISFLNQNTSWQHRAKEEGCFCVNRGSMCTNMRSISVVTAGLNSKIEKGRNTSFSMSLCASGTHPSVCAALTVIRTMIHKTYNFALVTITPRCYCSIFLYININPISHKSYSSPTMEHQRSYNGILENYSQNHKKSFHSYFYVAMQTELIL